MAPTFPCPRSHSALVHSNRQTDGGPSSCTSSSGARTSLETPTHSLTCPRSLSHPRLSICLSPSRSLSLYLCPTNGTARARSPSFLLSICISAPLSLSLSLSLTPPRAPLSVYVPSLSPSLFLPVCARSCCPPLFLLLRSPRRPAPSERTETTPSLSTKHQYITQQRHHTRPRKNEPRADY